MIDWPTVIPNLTNIKKIACNHHTAAIGSKGELYFWGTGVFGTYLQPRMVLDKNVVDVNIGGCFGMAQDMEGLLWTWGQNNSGELGLNDYKTRLHPHPILQLKKKQIKKFACGGAFAVALGKDKRIASKSNRIT